jgi:hypothetical protein
MRQEPLPAVLQPVADLLPGSLPPVRSGTLSGRWALDGDTIVLPSWLDGPDPFVQEHGPTPPIDRWRRALQAVHEASAALRFAAMWGIPYEPGWVWDGFLVDVADRALPGLGLADADVAAAIEGANPGMSPRTGVVVSRWWRTRGDDPATRTDAILRGAPLDREEWLAIGAWVFAVDGAGAALPVQVTRRTPADVPCEIQPWSWVRLDVPPHRRGGYVRPTEDAIVAQPWAPAGQRLVTLAGGLGRGGHLHAEVGGPVGRWAMASARAFGQIMGARGVEFEFRANGSWVVSLAAAVAGPVSQVDDPMGTSGMATGTWVVDGASTIRLAGLKTDQLGVHARGEKYALPGSQFGLGPAIQAMQSEPWQWKVEGGRLLLWGRMYGGSVEVWFDAA